jgi:hypothetical protein
MALHEAARQGPPIALDVAHALPGQEGGAGKEIGQLILADPIPSVDPNPDLLLA